MCQSPGETGLVRESQPKNPQPTPPKHNTPVTQAPSPSANLLPQTVTFEKEPEPNVVEQTITMPLSAVQPSSTTSTHELNAPELPNTPKTLSEAKGSDRSNWRIPESRASSRPRRQQHQRLVYDAETGLYRKPISK